MLKLNRVLRVSFLLAITIAIFTVFLNFWDSEASIERGGVQDDDSVIVYLVHPNEMDNLYVSISLVHKNMVFLRTSPYKIYLLHDKNLWSSSIMLMKTRIKSAFPGLRFEFKQIDWSLPAHYNQATDPPTAWVGGFPNYNIMIRFWFRQILFLFPDKRYYLRLDTDSFIGSEMKTDPFKLMKSKGWAYGYRGMDIDYPHVTQGMAQFLDKYIKGDPHALNVSQANKFQLPSPQDWGSYHPKAMYNNFEIVDMQRFRQTDMMKFIDAVDATNFMLTRRWGDAPLRYMQCALVLDWEKEVWNINDFQYFHGHHNFHFFPGSAEPFHETNGTYWESLLAAASSQ